MWLGTNIVVERASNIYFHCNILIEIELSGLLAQIIVLCLPSKVRVFITADMEGPPFRAPPIYPLYTSDNSRHSFTSSHHQKSRNVRDCYNQIWYERLSVHPHPSWPCLDGNRYCLRRG